MPMSIGRLKAMNTFNRRESCPYTLATLCSMEETRSSNALITLLEVFYILLRRNLPSIEPPASPS